MESKPRKDDHPRLVYQTPGIILADETLTGAQKVSLLEYWKTDLEAKLRAEGEGMQAQDSAESVEQIAEEHQQVCNALDEAKEN